MVSDQNAFSVGPKPPFLRMWIWPSRSETTVYVDSGFSPTSPIPRSHIALNIIYVLRNNNVFEKKSRQLQSLGASYKQVFP